MILLDVYRPTNESIEYFLISKPFDKIQSK